VALSRDFIASRVRDLRNDPTISNELMDKLIAWAYAWSGGYESNDAIIRVICARLYVVVGAPPR